jgi:hypothetical protein
VLAECERLHLSAIELSGTFVGVRSTHSYSTAKCVILLHLHLVVDTHLVAYLKAQLSAMPVLSPHSQQHHQVAIEIAPHIDPLFTKHRRSTRKVYSRPSPLSQVMPGSDIAMASGDRPVSSQSMSVDARSQSNKDSGSPRASGPAASLRPSGGGGGGRNSVLLYFFQMIYLIG